MEDLDDVLELFLSLVPTPVLHLGMFQSFCLPTDTIFTLTKVSAYDLDGLVTIYPTMGYETRPMDDRVI